MWRGAERKPLKLDFALHLLAVQVGKGIVYSDEDIDRLLDRSDLLRQQQQQANGQGAEDHRDGGEEEYLKAFKVMIRFRRC